MSHRAASYLGHRAPDCPASECRREETVEVGGQWPPRPSATATRHAQMTIGTWTGSRAQATMGEPKGKGWPGTRPSNAILTLAGKTARRTTIVSNPPTRRVRGTMSSPAQASSATPLQRTQNSGLPTNRGTIPLVGLRKGEVSKPGDKHEDAEGERRPRRSSHCRGIAHTLVRRRACRRTGRPELSQSGIAVGRRSASTRIGEPRHIGLLRADQRRPAQWTRSAGWNRTREGGSRARR